MSPFEFEQAPNDTFGLTPRLFPISLTDSSRPTSSELGTSQDPWSQPNQNMTKKHPTPTAPTKAAYSAQYLSSIRNAAFITTCLVRNSEIQLLVWTLYSILVGDLHGCQSVEADMGVGTSNEFLLLRAWISVSKLTGPNLAQSRAFLKEAWHARFARSTNWLTGKYHQKGCTEFLGRRI